MAGSTWLLSLEEAKAVARIQKNTMGSLLWMRLSGTVEVDRAVVFGLIAWAWSETLRHAVRISV